MNKKLGIVKKILSNEYDINGVRFIPVSALKRQGKEELMNELIKITDAHELKHEI